MPGGVGGQRCEPLPTRLEPGIYQCCKKPRSGDLFFPFKSIPLIVLYQTFLKNPGISSLNDHFLWCSCWFIMYLITRSIWESEYEKNQFFIIYEFWRNGFNLLQKSLTSLSRSQPAYVNDLQRCWLRAFFDYGFELFRWYISAIHHYIVGKKHCLPFTAKMNWRYIWQ